MHHVPSSDGVSVVVHRLGGRPGGRRTLFSHATGFHARCYLSVARALGDGFESFGLDHRGHGETPAPDGWEVDWRAFGDDTLAVASELAPPEGLLGIGHSMGGAALLMAAARRPSLFEELVLFEPIAFPPIPDGVVVDEPPIIAGARRRRHRFASRQEAIDNYAAKPPMSLMSRAALHDYVEYGFRDVDVGDDGDDEPGVELRCRPEIEVGVFVNARRNGVWDLLPTVEVPTLIVAGRVESHEPSGRAASIAERLPRGTYLELPHLTHFGPFSHPGEIAGLVTTPV